MMTNEKRYQYYAFISYSGPDEKWAAWLQHQLEYYYISSRMSREFPGLPRRIRPVFWYKQDLSGTKLTKALEEALEASQYLIVVCSPSAALSPWVNDEVTYFIDHGKADKIIPFIVDGIPHAKDTARECLPEVLRQLSRKDEIRGIDVHRKEGKKHALADVIATMFHVRLDDLWKRYQRRRRQLKCWYTALVISVLLVIAGVWYYNQPVDVSVSVSEAIPGLQLPEIRNAVVEVELDGEVRRDTVHTAEDLLLLRNIPVRLLGTTVPVRIVCQDFKSIDTTVLLTGNHHFRLHRNPGQYGRVRFSLYDLNRNAFVEGARLVISGQETFSGPEGKVSLDLPLESQRPYYKIESDIPLENDTLYLPCTDHTLILVK